jgi:hypothetical protein
VRPVEEFDLTVALDYGQFHLSGLPMHDGGTDALVRLVEEAATLQRVTIPVPSGRYAARVTGRGFLNHGWPGSTTPGDEWRLQLWPAAGPIPPRRVRSWMSRDEALAMEGSGWGGDLDDLRAPDVPAGRTTRPRSGGRSRPTRRW